MVETSAVKLEKSTSGKKREKQTNKQNVTIKYILNKLKLCTNFLTNGHRYQKVACNNEKKEF